METARAPQAAHPGFRLDNEHLCFRFTATVSHRAGAPLERLTTPAHVHTWLAANGLDPLRTPDDLALTSARALREAIYRVGAALSSSQRPSLDDIDAINVAAAAGHPYPQFLDSRVRWQLDASQPATDALAVIARDAVTTFGTTPPERLKTCEGTDCQGLFVDTSRGNNRRWCSMNTCGNKAKKTRMRLPSAPDDLAGSSADRSARDAD